MKWSSGVAVGDNDKCRKNREGLSVPRLIPLWRDRHPEQSPMRSAEATGFR
jgi:hypothetical protein